MKQSKHAMIRAIIFDMDGVLIDSEPFWREAEIEVFARAGVRLTEADCLLTVGMRIQEVATFWYARRPWQGASPDEVARKILQGVIDRVNTRGAPMPGLAGAIAFLRARGMRLALASSSSMTLIDAVLDRLSLRGAFEAICSADNETLGKPHPGVFLTTAAKLNLTPRECIVIEDSMNGVLAAKAAGMRCIAIPLPELRGDSRFAQADVVLESLADINAELLDKMQAMQP